MTAENENSGAPDPGLAVLVALLRFHGVGADPGQIRHRFGTKAIGVGEMLRCAKELGIKARAATTRWERLGKTPLPAIAGLKDGGFLILGKVSGDKIVVQSPLLPQPTLMSRDELEAVWDGRILLMARRARLSDLGRRFDVTWFMGAIHKYRGMLSEVLIASFFLQLFALVSPLFFQVVIDKVLVHRTLSTLDVLVIGLIAIGVFEAILGGLRTYLFAHTTNRIDVELGARLFRHLIALPIAYFEARRTGDSVARVSDQFGPDPGHRSVLHLCVPGGDVLVRAAIDLDRTRRLSVLYRDLCGGDAILPPPVGREVPPRRRKPGLSRRKRKRGRDAESDGG
jgi:subfamily B ATP-binding cassette protein HlyB/CyaB